MGTQALTPVPRCEFVGGCQSVRQSDRQSVTGQEPGGRTDRTLLARLVQIVLCLITAYWSTVERAMTALSALL